MARDGLERSPGRGGRLQFPVESAIALEYVETDYAVDIQAIFVGTHTTPFKKEPAGLTGKVFRGSQILA